MTRDEQTPAPDRPPAGAGPAEGSTGVGGRHVAPSFGRAVGLTVLGAVVPGVAFLAAGRRRLGLVTLTVFLLVVAGAVWLATAGRRTAVRASVDPTQLTWLVAAIVAAATLWVIVVLAGYRMLLPRRARGWQHAVGTLVVLLLVGAVVAPSVAGVRLANTQRGLIDSVFADDRQSATIVPPPDAADPFGDKERVNVLLLGGDGGAGREGVRTDTVIVASIETATGRTTLFSLPRNLENLPFPASSPLAALYPRGFVGASESEGLLNAVYRNGPATYPDALGPSSDPGADWLKLGVGEALGLPIDYFVLVNLDGFSQLVDALGGITVNVNYYVPVGGEPTRGILPDSYIAPGPDQTMSGPRALDFARGRFGLSDYQRMDRQRCVLDAIVAAADPVTLLSQYQRLAATTAQIVSTDIPQAVLSDFVDLAFLVKDAGIRSVVFDDTVIDPAYPDYPRIRSLVQQALGADTAAPTGPGGTTAPTTAPTTTAPTPAAVPTTPAPAPTGAVGDDVSNVCAYDPVAAQAAIAAGQPPTRGG
ncbi:LytR family transcriptional regulator [Modestobacter sp. I12A-02628]|uniref:LCP family protein n=1 Tax=Goekera deserti TaxID=2497753 RepID=A0A7K3WJ92_9ACTN|nr:LytR family transcriptional regulator [Goekera deserti]NDI50472.1 LytR family transcriptional regulator [Goekera deserti]NEL56568.1 LCP family protein [Goekera deserti]